MASLNRPESFFDSSPKLNLLVSDLSSTSNLSQFQAFSVLKTIVARFDEFPEQSTTALGLLACKKPDVLAKQIQGRLAVLLLLESTFRLNPELGSQGIEVLIASWHNSRQLGRLYPEIIRFILTSLEISVQECSNNNFTNSLSAILEFPLLSQPQIAKLCTLTRYAMQEIKLRGSISSKVLEKGISLSPLWVEVCVDWILGQPVTSLEDQRFILSIINELVSCSILIARVVHTPSSPLVGCLHQVIAGEPIDWPSLPDELLPLRDKIDLKWGFAVKNVSESDTDQLQMLLKKYTKCDGPRQELPAADLNQLTQVIDSPRLLKEKELRILACEVLHSCLSHYSPSFALDHSSILGSWCIGCLKSSNRQLRTQASRLVPHFINASKPVREATVRQLIAFLPETTFETVVDVWVQAGSVAVGEDLNVMILRLIDSLGSKNTFHSSLARTGLQVIARKKTLTPYQLFAPFWATISITVTRKFMENSVHLERFCSLINISTSEFFVRTASFLVPYSVLARRADLAKLVAEARICSTNKLYIDFLPQILSTLLCRRISTPFEFAEQRWLELDRRFANIGFEKFLTSQPAQLYFEILKKAPGKGNDDAAEAHIISVLKQLYNEECSSDTPSQGFIFRIVALFSDVMRNFQGRTTTVTKVQCLKGLELFIRLHINDLEGVTNQISTLLQASLSDKELEESSMRAWTTLATLSFAKLSQVTFLTLTVISQNYEIFLPSTRLICTQFLDTLLESLKTDGYRGELGLPRLGGELQEYQEAIDAIMNPSTTDFSKFLENLMVRCENENVHVVRQTIKELIDFLLKDGCEQYFGLRSVKFHMTFVSAALRSLLDLASRFRESGTDIPEICADAIGLIGAIDPNRVDLVPLRLDPVVAFNFNDTKENAKFVAYFVESKLLKEFEATIDPDRQMFVAYGMQELLKYCGFTSQCPGKFDFKSRWNRLFHSWSATVLTPFLYTKYKLGTTPPAKRSSPIYNSTISYSMWLAQFTDELMSRGYGTHAEVIFSQCRRILRSDESFTALFEFLLPYVSLNVILAKKNSSCTIFLTELDTILDVEATDGDDMSLFHKRLFSVLDYFNTWLRASKQTTRIDVKPLEHLLASVSPIKMAQRAFECHDYPRAIQYWERVALMDGSFASSKDIGDFFRQLYARMGDTDSLEGISNLFPSLSPEQQLLEYENTHDWDTANSFYCVLDKWDISTNERMLASLRDSGRSEDVLSRLVAIETSQTYVENLVLGPQSTLRNMQLSPRMAGIGIDAAAHCGDMKALKKWTMRVTGNDEIISGHIGHALLALAENNISKVSESLHNASRVIVKEITRFRVTSLGQIRDMCVYLHGLADLASTSQLFTNPEAYDYECVLHSLDQRLDRVGPDYGSRQYLLSLRRAIFQLKDLPMAKEMVSQTYYYAARDARKRHQWTQAFSAALKAISSNHPLGLVEQSKVLWAQGHFRRAIKSLEKDVDPVFVANCESCTPDNQYWSAEGAKKALLYTDWLDGSSQASSLEIVARYVAIYRMRPKWDKAVYRLAKKQTRMLESLRDADTQYSSFYDGSIVKNIVKNYLRTVSKGTKYVTECLPKVITMWLTFAADIELSSHKHMLTKAQLDSFVRQRRFYLNEINETVRYYFTDNIPTYVLYMGLSQLLSRISHPESSVYSEIRHLIRLIAIAYPAQSLWSIIEPKESSKHKSKGTEDLRKSRILELSRSLLEVNDKDLCELVQEANSLILSLKEVCDYRVDKTKSTIKLSSIGFDQKCCPNRLSVPIQSSLSAILPSCKLSDDFERTYREHNPFQSLETIVEFDDVAAVQTSLQRPKRLRVLSSDGRYYSLLCKGKDDVRKDARLIEFTTHINTILEADEEAAARHLGIKVYRVTPIDEASGIIEWVDGAQPIKKVLEKQFKAHGITLSVSVFKNLFDRSVDASKRLENWYHVCDKLKPNLSEWFLAMFPDPSAWIEARSTFARSTAVMSIVGYILGLGDRHLENLLLLDDTGYLLHVDFDCLFEKGETFTVPERVPFRLTPNIVDAMGVQGYEGPFRKACELTLKLLRDHEELLMTVLEPFLHDPVMGSHMSHHHKLNPQKALQRIQSKIQGLTNQDATPLSVSGHVQYLIQEATSPELLSQMFLGWASFL